MRCQKFGTSHMITSLSFIRTLGLTSDTDDVHKEALSFGSVNYSVRFPRSLRSVLECSYYVREEGEEKRQLRTTQRLEATCFRRTERKSLSTRIVQLSKHLKSSSLCHQVTLVPCFGRGFFAVHRFTRVQFLMKRLSKINIYSSGTI